MAYETLVQDIFQEVLGREAQEEGLSYWTEQLTIGNLTESNIKQAITTAAQPELAARAATEEAPDLTIPTTTTELTTPSLEIDVASIISGIQASMPDYQGMLEQSQASMTALIEQQQLQMQELSSGVTYKDVAVTTGTKTLAEQDLERRRETVDMSRLGAKRLQIGLETPRAKRAPSSLNVPTGLTGLSI